MNRIILLVLLGFSGTLYSTPPAPVSPDKPDRTDLFKQFWSVAEVIDRIEKKSFRLPNLQSIIETGLKHMVTAVDAHSTFFTPESYQTTIDLASGQFPGIGVSVLNKEVSEETLLIVDTLPGSPAQKAGIIGGDKIIEVGGKMLRGLSSDEVVALLKGKVHTTISLTILRDKKRIPFTLTREVIKEQSTLAYQFPNQNVSYIALKTFSEKTAGEVKEHLTNAYKRNSTGIILDLRRNPGGVLDAAVTIAGFFLPKGSLVTQTRRRDRSIHKEYRTVSDPIHRPEIPLYLLTDTFTASASEVLSGCLQHYAHKEKDTQNGLKLFVIGTTTYGKGSVQEIMPLSNGCALKLTTDLYYLPNNKSIQATGVTPDYMVQPKRVPLEELKWVEGLYGKEKRLKNHITREEVEQHPENKTAEQSSSTKPHQTIEKKQQDKLSNDSVVRFALSCNQLTQLIGKISPDKITTRSGVETLIKSTLIDDKPITIIK